MTFQQDIRHAEGEALASMSCQNDPNGQSKMVDFIEGTHIVDEDELLESSVIPYNVTGFYEKHIRSSTYYDQLRHIVEPSVEELVERGELDTSNEVDSTIATGLQHKYKQTAVILVTARCFSFCRFCFRKRLFGSASGEANPDYDKITSYIREHPEIDNVLLTGGDPFMLGPKELNHVVDRLLPLPNVTSIRFGTKGIVYSPLTFTEKQMERLFAKIIEAGKTAVIVTQIDHFAEISNETEEAIKKLRDIGVQFLNQAVLLRKVNDDAITLSTTFQKLRSMDVQPYYLFQARPVRGAVHFQVPFALGVEIVHEINKRLSGIHKTFRYMMSHSSGKIEILDLSGDGRIYMRYHQCSNIEKIGKMFSMLYVDGACWLDDLIRDNHPEQSSVKVAA